MRHVRLALFFCACISLAGCVLFVRGVDDLRLVDVQPVQVGAVDTLRTERPNLPSSYVIGGLVVATQADIRKIREESQLNIWYTLTICNTGTTVRGWAGVYEHGVNINPNPMIKSIQSTYRHQATSHDDNEPYIYEIYFDPRSAYSEPIRADYPWKYRAYDLVREPQDLCLRVRGGNMVGGRFASNTIVVSSAQIAHAFLNVPRESP